MSENLKQLFFDPETGKIKCAQSGSTVFHADVIADPLRDIISVSTDHDVHLDIDVRYTDESRSAIASSHVRNGQGNACGPVSIVSDDELNVIAWDDGYKAPKIAAYTIDLDNEVVVEEGCLEDPNDGTVSLSAMSESRDKLIITTPRFVMNIEVQYTDDTKAEVESITYDESVAAIESFSIIEEGFSFKMAHAGYEIPKVATYCISRGTGEVGEVDGPDSGQAVFNFIPFISDSDISCEAVDALLEEEIFPDVIFSVVDGNRRKKARGFFIFTETDTDKPGDRGHLFSCPPVLDAVLFADGRFEIV